MKKSFKLVGLLVLAAIAVVVFVGPKEIVASTTGYLYGHGLYIQSVPGTTVASISNTGAMTVTSLTNSGATTNTGNLTVSGQLILPSVSSTTIVTLVPAAVGAVVYNTTRASICIGTAAVAGAWVFASTNGVTTAGLTCKE